MCTVFLPFVEGEKQYYCYTYKYTPEQRERRREGEIILDDLRSSPMRFNILELEIYVTVTYPLRLSRDR